MRFILEYIRFIIYYYLGENYLDCFLTFKPKEIEIGVFEISFTGLFRKIPWNLLRRLKIPDR